MDVLVLGTSLVVVDVVDVVVGVTGVIGTRLSVVVVEVGTMTLEVVEDTSLVVEATGHPPQTDRSTWSRLTT